jgi:hypothetical protein
MIDSSERLEMNFPWWADIVQKEHPPKHPRWIVTESFIISKAGIASFPL